MGKSGKVRGGRPYVCYISSAARREPLEKFTLCTLQVCCTPGWNRSVSNVTFLRRYSAAPVWDEFRASLALDPQRRRPLLMWQGHSRHPWLCPCRDRRVGRLFGSIVRGALNIRIRWRPPSAHQAAAAAGRAIFGALWCGCRRRPLTIEHPPLCNRASPAAPG